MIMILTQENFTVLSSLIFSKWSFIEFSVCDLLISRQIFIVYPAAGFILSSWKKPVTRHIPDFIEECFLVGGVYNKEVNKLKNKVISWSERHYGNKM